MLERVKFESFWLRSPAFGDVFVRCEALEGLQPPSVVVGIDEVGKVGLELLVSIIMIALDSRFLDRAVHAFDLSIGPWMIGLCQPVLDGILEAGAFKHMNA